MELIRYWRVIRRWSWIIVLCPIVAVLVATAVTLRMPNVYEAHVTVLVRPAQVLAPGPGGAGLTADQIVLTYAHLMTKQPILEQVIKDEGLHSDWVSLSKQITVTPDPNTLILNVAVQDTDPARARDIANILVNDFVAHVKTIESNNSTTNPADNLIVDSPAELPTEPVWPRPLLNIAVGLLAGLLAGLGLAFLFDYLDQSVRSDEVLRERVGLVPLGHIAYVAARTEKRGELVALAGDSPVAEAYKALRTNLLFSGVDKELKTIVITSASPNEGKSRTAANLAIVLAQAGHSTLLVDADFRRPSLHRMFGKVRNVGLSNLIVGELAESGAFVPDEQVKNLTLLPSGPTPPNPSELLGSYPMKVLLERFRKGFDYTVIDTPPVNAVTDASVLAAHADAVMLVIDTNKATYPVVQHAKQALERVGARLLGTVMNKMRASGTSYYYTQYAYGYGSPNGSPKASETASPTAAPEQQRR